MYRDRLDCYLIAIALFCSVLLVSQVSAEEECDDKCREAPMTASVVINDKTDPSKNTVSSCFQYKFNTCAACGTGMKCLTMRPPGSGSCTNMSTDDQGARTVPKTNCKANCKLDNVIVEAFWIIEPTDDYTMVGGKVMLCTRTGLSPGGGD